MEHWRSSPEALDAVRRTGVVREAWIDDVLGGTVDPGPSAVALMTNLRVAGEARDNG